MVSLQPHKQVPCKVTAYVDEGIRDLVELLNTFDGVWTTSSCEDNKAEELELEESTQGWATVTMFYKPLTEYSPKDSAEFADKLAKVLLENDIWHLVSLEWHNAGCFPSITLKIPCCQIKEATIAFSSSCSRFHSTRNKSLLCCPS